MRAVGRKNTRPEIIVRRLAHSMGYRFRLHRRDLPGKPDIVFPGRRKVIFVHGCFWHGHDCPRGARPQSNIEFWHAKLARNVDRDRLQKQALRALGWEPLVVWECETKDREGLANALRGFLG
jgi:DNA mismatch endonuclease (patch repair protein)